MNVLNEQAGCAIPVHGGPAPEAKTGEACGVTAARRAAVVSSLAGG